MMTKSVLVPSLSSGLHIQGSSCLLGPPQPPKTLATMHRTPLPHSQLPLTQHQGAVETPEGDCASLSCTWTLWAELWGLIVLAAGLPGPTGMLKPGWCEGRCQAPPQGCQVGEQKQTPGQAGPWGTWEAPVPGTLFQMHERMSEKKMCKLVKY